MSAKWRRPWSIFLAAVVSHAFRKLLSVVFFEPKYAEFVKGLESVGERALIGRWQLPPDGETWFATMASQNPKHPGTPGGG
jgi:hypothetical protein